MVRTVRRTLVAAALAVLSVLHMQTVCLAADVDKLCSLVPDSYGGARTAHPEVATALAKVAKHSIATWYSDRNGDYGATLRQLVKHCAPEKRLSIVIYGLPNKDCEAGYSATGGAVETASDYRTFVQQLMNAVGSRKALYVLEPDAVGLLAKKGGCAETAGYRANLKAAIASLSTNNQAEIYVDIGYWTLQYPETLANVVAVVQDLATAGTIKGVAINTSNYRSTAEITTLCSNFQRAMGSTDGAYRCIVDTSRNFVAPTSTEWCNVRSAGIGHVPTATTGVANLAYFLWIKPPGESDGACSGSGHTPDAMRGPNAGAFFADGFTQLWNQGYFVQTLGRPAIRGGYSNISSMNSTARPATLAQTTARNRSTIRPTANLTSPSPAARPLPSSVATQTSTMPASHVLTSTFVGVPEPNTTNKCASERTKRV